MRDFAEKAWKAAREYKWFIVFFCIFLAIQLWQASFLEWDRITYLFQGKWFCGEQIYFEWLRPPMPGIMNCLFGAGEISTIVSALMASTLYFSAILLIYKNEKGKINQLLFPALAFLFPTILFASNFGSDLLALSFLLLALSINGPTKKGLFFALATLSRYNFFLYVFVLLLEMEKKHWPKFLLVVAAIWLPWLAFNYAYTGNAFFSLQETIALNIQQKGLFKEFDLGMLATIGFFLATLALGKAKAFGKYNLSAIAAALQVLVSGIKEYRFLNALVPAQALNISAQKINGKLTIAVILLLIAGAAYGFVAMQPAEKTLPKEGFLKECRVMSNEWVYLYRAGIVAEPLPDSADTNALSESGVAIVLMDEKNAPNKGDFNIIKGGSYIILKPKNCSPQPKKYELRVS